MNFKIPFSFSPLHIQKEKSKNLIKRSSSKKKSSKLDEYLISCGVNLTSQEYLAICKRALMINFPVFYIISLAILWVFNISYFYLFSVFIAMFFSGFIYFNQINYPKIFSANKQRSLEKNLIPSLQDVLVQLNSGVSLFNILINISRSSYGEVSIEFKKIANEINSGVPEIDAIDKYARLNSSPYFRRVLWQISDGMRSGSDMAVVVRENIKNLSEEQAIQIQAYGSKLNPLIMFYMLIAVILPSLGITFLIILSSMLSATENIIKLILVGCSVIIIFMQLMFLGIIKSRRPSLL